MKKVTALRILNPVLGVLIITQVLSGIFHMRLSLRTFEAVHETGGILILVLVVIHLALNWNWVRSSYFAAKSRKG